MVDPVSNPAGGTASGLCDLTPDALGALIKAWEQPTYRAAQILKWVYQRGATSYDDMTDQPAWFRARLAEHLPLYRSTVVRQLEARDGTIKLLLAWPDDATTECVLICDGPRRTACLSTQVGCPVGCVFCASGLDGLSRQLSTGEIVEQALRVRQLCGGADRLTNVVFMGLGEPLANYQATVAAVRAINASWGLAIGARRITVSTVGLPVQMRRLADEGMQITLALSLHAPNDELRKQIIPWAQRVDMESLIEAARYYFDRTGREVTLEYVLLDGVNDAPEQAAGLASILGRMRGNVNLISYNPVPGLAFKRATPQATRRFLNVLRARGATAHLRPSRGQNIEAACGQLRRRTRAGDSELNHGL